MYTGIALPVSELPTEFIERPEMKPRLYVRGEVSEARFFWWQSPQVLPVQWYGRLQALPWGCKDRRGYVVYMLTTDATNYYKNMTE